MDQDMQREAYAEEMYERSANGLPQMTFAQWQEQKAKLRALFEASKNERG